MSSDAFRRVAKYFQDRWAPERAITTNDLVRVLRVLANDRQANRKTTEPQPATPSVRESCRLLAKFVDRICEELDDCWRHNDAGRILAAEARMALAAEPETGIVAELVTACIDDRGVFENRVAGVTIAGTRRSHRQGERGNLMDAQEIVERIMTAHWSDDGVCPCWLCKAGNDLFFACRDRYLQGRDNSERYPVPNGWRPPSVIRLEEIEYERAGHQLRLEQAQRGVTRLEKEEAALKATTTTKTKGKP